jgi:SAM-dependent methyltransferase
VGSIPFDRVADRYDKTRGGAARGRAFVPTLLPLLRGDRVVEVGVGTGVVASALSESGVAVVGFDLSLPMIEQARARLGSRVAVADAHHLPLADDSVDTLLFVWVLHLVGDVASVLRECSRALAPDGRIVACAGGPRPADDDEIAAAVAPLEALRSPEDEPSRLIELADGEGLVLIDDVHTPWLRFEEAPTARADLIESRAQSTLWDLDDETWERVVTPVVTRLRALSEPGQPRTRAQRYRVFVFEPR